MQIHFGLGRFNPEWPRSVACIGTFDGVHVGHRAVIRTAVRTARERELPNILLTFDRHPAAILNPNRTPLALASLEENLAGFKALGVEMAIVLPFDAALSRTSADRFLHDILKVELRAEAVVVGHDFAMGNGREGTAEWLSHRIETIVVPPYELDGVRVSSSQIRDAIQRGDIATANAALGRPFSISGAVATGQKLGRTLGFPTVNLVRSFDQVVPSDGIYAAIAHTIHGAYEASLYIGYRPTVDGQTRSIEAYLLDYPGESLYGTLVRLDVMAKVRDDREFTDLEALKTQMELDVNETRRLLTSIDV